MSDQLAEDLLYAANKLTKPNDVRFVRSLLAQHQSGKELSPSQMFYAKEMIKRAGRQAPVTEFAKVEQDIFAADAPEPVAAPLPEVPDAGEANDMLNLANEAKLEAIIGRVLRPLADNLIAKSDEHDANLASRQDQFNRTAAKSIAHSVVDECLKRLDARVPRQVIIKVERNGEQRTVEGVQHPNFEKLMRHLLLRGPDSYSLGIFLAGERGSGKTTGCRNAAKALGLTWYSNGAISDPVEMLGYRDANGNYHTTPFRQAYEFGGLYTFDEVDRSDPNALLAVNPHLANQEAAFPDGMVKRHKDCLLTATGNTWGLGGSLEFSGACKLDEAFLSRYPIKMAWDVDLPFERKIVGNDAWMNYVQAARERVKAAGIKYTIDSRAALAGAAMIAQQGATFEQAAADTFLASMKAEQRQITMGARG